MNQYEMPIFSALPDLRRADEKTLRLCDSEQDAICAAIALSHLTQVEIAKRMGISKGYLTLLKQGHRALTSKQASRLASATGWDVVGQYRAMQLGIRIAMGATRHRDRIELIVAPTYKAAA